MFIESLVSKAKGKLRRCSLPRFTLKNRVGNQVYNYYSACFLNMKQKKCQLVSLRDKNAVLEEWCAEQHICMEEINLPLNDTKKMNTEIIHWRKQGPSGFSSIFLFAISYFTRIAYVENALTRAKSNPFPSFASSKALGGLGRITLPQVLVGEYVYQSPEKTHTKVTCDEVIGLLYETL